MPKVSVILGRMQTLAYLLFISSYLLLGDSHNNGYFLLRLPDVTRAAVVLIRGEGA